MQQSRILSAAFGSLVLFLHASAFGQEETDMLRGPKVPEADRRTIVHAGMQSGFERVEGRPEAAAVMLLDIEPERKRKIEAVIREHDMKVAMLLVDRIDDVRVISDAVVAGDEKQAEKLLGDLWRIFDPQQQRSPLLVELGPLLSDSEQAEVKRMVDEYWEAWIRSAMPGGGMEMDEAKRGKTHERVEQKLAFRLFQEEVRRGYELTLRRYKQVLDGIYGAVEPTDTQREAIRSVVFKHIKETRLEPTQAQRRETYLEIYNLLDEDRRAKLFEYLLRQILQEG